MATHKKKEYSGKLVIRINPATHETLAVKADENYLSLNALINKVLDTEAKKTLKKV